ncbi:MAG: hypothetical protein B7Y48_07425 [Methylophilales bacterium 28-44-11]|nr:MAG: hypothetical protein B7Y48_07425 [Methylophilales bacterium 28-44-11]
MQSQSFKHRVIRSSLWIFSGNALTQIIRFISNLIMTRLLAPEMFGLMALAGVFIFGLNLLSDIGLKQILIQSKRSDERFVNTVWTIQVVRGWMIWLLSIAVAAVFYVMSAKDLLPVNSVYNNEMFPYIIAVIGLNSVFSGYEPTKLTYGNRNLNLRLNVTIALISQVIGFIAMMLWAYYQPDVWALVVGSLVATLSMTVLSLYLIDGKANYWCWDKEIYQEILHFGKWIFVSSIMGFLVMSSDKLMLGGLVDAKSLGYFAIAGLLVGAVVQLIGSLIHTVGFPALSETFRENPNALGKVFYKLRLPFDLILMFSCSFLFVTADMVVDILYDARYQSVGWILQILSISLFEVRYRLAGECFLAMGKPKLQSSLILVNLVCLYVFGFSMYYMFGFKGLVWAVACSALSTIPLILFYLRKYNILDWKKELVVLPVLVLGYMAGMATNFIYDKFI